MVVDDVDVDEKDLNGVARSVIAKKAKIAVQSPAGLVSAGLCSAWAHSAMK